MGKTCKSGWPGNEPGTGKRKNSPGYEERFEARKQQAHPSGGRAKPSPAIPLKGRSRYSNSDEQRKHLAGKL